MDPNMFRFVIHDRRREDRHKLFTQELESQDCDDYFISDAVIHPNPKTGISRAHKVVVETAKGLGLDYAMVIEDDVKFTHPKSLSLLEDLFLKSRETMPCDLFLGGLSFSSSKIGISRTISEATTLLYYEYNLGVTNVGRFTGLHCYIITKRFYDKFLSADENMNIDAWVSSPRFGNAKTYCVYPILAISYPGYSDNAKKIVDYDDHFSKFEQLKADI